MLVNTPYNIVFATGNKGKFMMLENALKDAGVDNAIGVSMQDMDLVEIQDDSVANISMHKAKQAWDLLQKPVLVHDSGLNIPAYNGFPGPYTKYISKSLGAQGFVDLLRDKDDKRMIFYNCVTYVDENGNTHQFSDDTGDNIQIADYVSTKKRPDQWSDLWQIIIPKGFGYNKTLSEMDNDEFNEYIDRRTKAGTDGAYNSLISYLTDKIMVSSQKTGVL